MRQLTSRHFLAALGVALSLQAASAGANPFVYGNARITVVTPECIRLEYQSAGRFVDAPSMFAVGRDKLASNVVEEARGTSHVLHTGKVQLVYTPNGKPFSDSNLRVEIESGERSIVWTPSAKQTGNLGGTINTLDQVKGPVSLEEGILSRDGWYLLDDSKGHLLVNDWVAARPADAGTDWYLFAYGDDYAAAFKAFTTIGGAVPMPRKAVLGSWYSRWWKYTTQDYHDIVNEYGKHDFPLDIIVMDMEWHQKGWTGWSWNHELLEDPPALLKWFHDQGLAVTLNVHPADGVLPHETRYAEFMKDLGKDPASGDTVTYDAGDKRYMEAHFRHMHHPLEDEGCDFWWLDWQQYPEVKSIPGLLNLSWLNKLYFDNSMRKGNRGLQFSRWGAWGDHRHPIHFSGDADTGWAMLGFEVPFTTTAANEGAYFWSHDIGGHFGQRNEEPYTRWVQFASTTAAMRIHSGIIEYLDRRPWKWPDWGTESMRRAFHLRSELMPYVYSAVRATNVDGLPLNRPMYLEWPGEPDAYMAPQQFLLGTDLLVAPIASAGYGPGRVASQLVWFPPGEWRNFFTSETFVGPQWRLVSADINEFPLYVRAGVPVPMQPYSPRPTTAKLEELVVRVWPGAEGARHDFELYEDDGISRAYEKGGFATTKLSSQREGDTLEIRIAGAEGTYEGQVARRGYKVVVGGVEKPGRVRVNGKRASADWDAENRTATVVVKPRSSREAVVVTVEAKPTDAEYFAKTAQAHRLAGLGVTGTTDLAAAILVASEAKSENLPGLLALGGVAIAENGTHYPKVGTLERLVRNPDSVVDAAGAQVSWSRKIVPAVPGAQQAGVSFGNQLVGPVTLFLPSWSAMDLAFMQSTTDSRTLTVNVGGKPVSVTKQLGIAFGQIHSWSVSKPFPFDRKKEISEQKYEPELAQDRLATIATNWQKVEAGPDGVVDLGKAIGGEDRIAYATATMDLPEAHKAILSFRSDDGIEVWLNGEKIHSKHAFRGLNHDWEEVPANLRKGNNVLLVKISQAEFGWGFVVAGRDE